MEKLKAYMIALRPWSFSASLTPVLLGSALAYNHLNKNTNTDQVFQFSIMFLSLITALCVHGAGWYFEFSFFFQINL
jgi:menadiol prenyltransferase